MELDLVSRYMAKITKMKSLGKNTDIISQSKICKYEITNKDSIYRPCKRRENILKLI